MAAHLTEAYRADIDNRTRGLQPHTPDGWRVEATDITPGIVLRDSNVTVTAFQVPHDGWAVSYGYRFEGGGRVIVVSGDTRPTDAIVAACNGCDVLVHEVYSTAGLARRPPDWQRYHKDAHTSTAELAEIAGRARPKLLVLYHQLYWGTSDEDLVRELRTDTTGLWFPLQTWRSSPDKDGRHDGRTNGRRATTTTGRRAAGGRHRAARGTTRRPVCVAPGTGGSGGTGLSRGGERLRRVGPRADEAASGAVVPGDAGPDQADRPDGAIPGPRASTTTPARRRGSNTRSTAGRRGPSTRPKRCCSISTCSPQGRASWRWGCLRSAMTASDSPTPPTTPATATTCCR